MNHFDAVAKAYGRDVKDVAAELVESGRASPWQAMRQAHDIVQQRRQMDQITRGNDILRRLTKGRPA